MKRSGKTLTELTAGMTRLPQTMLSVKVAEQVDPHTVPGIRDATDRVESQLGDRGRVVLRASGTEPVIRVMVEGEDRDTVAELAQSLADSVRSSLNA
jgi:phosphoglucosamine mutase